LVGEESVSVVTVGTAPAPNSVARLMMAKAAFYRSPDIIVRKRLIDALCVDC
jgi:hypothetical protein